jgi:hypothetical protein
MIEEVHLEDDFDEATINLNSLEQDKAVEESHDPYEQIKSHDGQDEEETKDATEDQV